MPYMLVNRVKVLGEFGQELIRVHSIVTLVCITIESFID